MLQELAIWCLISLVNSTQMSLPSNIKIQGTAQMLVILDECHEMPNYRPCCTANIYIISIRTICSQPDFRLYVIFIHRGEPCCVSYYSTAQTYMDHDITNHKNNFESLMNICEETHPKHACNQQFELAVQQPLLSIICSHAVRNRMNLLESKEHVSVN